MNKNQMAELLYALPDGVVVKGRKSKVVPLCLTLAGVVLLVVNGLLPATAGYEDLKSALVLFGGVIFATGVLLLLVRLFGDSGVPLLSQIGRLRRGRLPDASRLGASAQHRSEPGPCHPARGLPYARRGVRGLPGVRIRRVGGAAPHGVAHRAFRPRGVAEYVVMRRNRTVCGIVRFPAISGAGRIVDDKMEEICC